MGAVAQRDLRARDRADPPPARRGEGERSAKTVVVGEGEGAVAQLGRPLGHLLGGRRAVEEAEGRVGVELDVGAVAIRTYVRLSNGRTQAVESGAVDDGLIYLEDLRVGQRFTTGEYALEADDITAFARQYDPQPFHTDQEAARDSFFGGLVASGWHTAGITMRLVEGLPIAGGVIGAGGQLDWPAPTRPGLRVARRGGGPRGAAIAPRPERERRWSASRPSTSTARRSRSSR